MNLTPGLGVFVESLCTEVNLTATQVQTVETMNDKTAGVLMMSQTGGNHGAELIDSAELAKRLRVPESWIRNRTRARTPRAERIPCLRLGRYVRFEWGSVPLSEWLSAKRN